MTGPVRVGIIGAGFGQQVHVPAFRADARCEVVAICARTLEHAARAAERLGIPQAYGDARQMLADGQVDGVSIAVPPVAQPDLVITAAAHALTPLRPDVSVYVLNMGQPVKIVDLAERMIRLSGLQPGHDIDIVFTEIRPGERLNEMLFATEEPAVEIGVAGIMAAKPNEPPMASLRKWIAALEQAIAGDDRATIKAVLKDAVPEFGSVAPEQATSSRPLLHS